MGIQDQLINLKLAVMGSEGLSSERFRRLSKEGIWILFGEGMAVLGALFGVRLMTHIISPSVYGELALGMTVATLLNQTLFGPLEHGTTRFFAPALEQHKLASYFKAVRRLALWAAGTVVLLIPILAGVLQMSGRKEWTSIAIAAAIFSIVSGYNSILSGFQLAARQRSIVALHQAMASWGRFLVAAGLLLCFARTSTAAMVGYVIALVFVCGSQYIFLQKLIPSTLTEANESSVWLHKITKYAWPGAAWGIFTWAQQSSDRWALGVFANKHDVGLYAVLFQLGYYPTALATGLIVQLLAPIFYQRAGDGTDRKRNASVAKLGWQLTGLAMGVTGVLCVGAELFNKQIFRILVAKEYAAVAYLLPGVILAGGLFAAGQTIALNLVSRMKTQEMIPAKIWTALFGVVLNFAGAYWYGAPGIVCSGVVFSVTYFLWMFRLATVIGSD